ncbi:MAG: hypothetical protein ABR886_07515 [Dehalococcoidales bacterium]|jgi:hypothetical protein
MTTSDLVVLGVGIYAGATATATLIWNILRERRNVIVRIRHAFEIGLGTKTELLAVEIINNGRRPINIQENGFYLPNKAKLINPNAQHNLGWLRDGDGTTYYIPKQEIDEMVKHAKENGNKIAAVYIRDSTNRHYSCRISKRDSWFR